MIIFQTTENMMEDNAFETTLIPNPRKSNPTRPDDSIKVRMASMQDMGMSDVCLNVLTTRIPLEQQSDTTEEQNPINARLTMFIR